MVLLILIALAQLGVLVLILVCLSELASQENAQHTAEQSIRDIQNQTVASMFTAAGSKDGTP